MMKSRLSAIALALALMPTASLYAQSLRDGKVAFTAGDWKVLRSIDKMRDRVSCTGIYKENYSTQLSSDSLFIGVQGGITSVILRFGEKPARELRLAQEMEKKIRAIIVTGSEFAELGTSSRLLYQANTLVGGLNSGEIDLAGFNETLASIRADCPIQSEAPPAATVPVPKESICTSALLDRMRAQGIREEQIQAVCQ